MRKKNKRQVCGACGVHFTAYPHLSRYDNKTNVCPECGQVEAFSTPLILQAREMGLSFADYGRLLRKRYKDPFIKGFLAMEKKILKTMMNGGLI